MVDELLANPSTLLSSIAASSALIDTCAACSSIEHIYLVGFPSLFVYELGCTIIDFPNRRRYLEFLPLL